MRSLPIIVVGFLIVSVLCVPEAKALEPTVTITSTAPDPTNTTPIPVTVTFSEPVTGFTSGDVALTNATLSNFASADTYYTKWRIQT